METKNVTAITDENGAFEIQVAFEGGPGIKVVSAIASAGGGSAGADVKISDKGTTQPPPSGSQSFSYNGGNQDFTVPALVTQVTIDAYGAQGGNGGNNNGGGAKGGMYRRPFQ